MTLATPHPARPSSRSFSIIGSRSAITRAVAVLAATALPLASPTAWAAETPEIDPLALEAAPAAEAPAKAQADGKLFLEVAGGLQARRYGMDTQGTHRVSLDFSRRFKPAPQWHAALSNRLDHLQPPGEAGDPRTLNSLREAYVGWTADSGATLVEFGRINVRHGPGYGYNPTDFLRAGSLRSPTTVDPMQLRENRLGTVMLRGQHLAGDHSLSLVLAPKLENAPERRSWSLDLGATNSRDRALATWGLRWSETFSTQLLAFGEQGRNPQWGASATALLSEAVVGHAEWSSAREPSALDRVLAAITPQQRRDRAALGLTMALPAKVSLTVEYAYNGLGLSRGDLPAAQAAGPLALGHFLADAADRQDQASRHAWTVYATKTGLVLRKLDLTALLRHNAVDHSLMGWLELRHRWDGADLALQWQWQKGNPLTEYGLPTMRRALQVMGVWYF